MLKMININETEMIETLSVNCLILHWKAKDCNAVFKMDLSAYISYNVSIKTQNIKSMYHIKLI
jgi:hypothetical protein